MVLRQAVGKKEEFALILWWLGTGEGGWWRWVPGLSRFGSPTNWPHVPGQGREVKEGRGLSFKVAPGSVSAVNASVHKGIWRAWWRPPCYLVQAQKGVPRAFLPTCDHSLSA